MEAACVASKQASLGTPPVSFRCALSTSGPPLGCSPAALWRPWLATAEDARRAARRRQLTCPYSRAADPHSCVSDGKTQSFFQHPVRLFWPKSKSYDYLYSDGQALLKNFPAQATINFYEESDSEEEEEEDDDDNEGCETEEEEEESESGCHPSRTSPRQPPSGISCYN